jgi:hypothetical protein
MRGSVRLSVIAIAAVTLLTSGLASAGQAASAAVLASAASAVTSGGHQAPAPPAQQGSGAQAKAVAAAAARAEATGNPVAIPSMTTATSLTTADPHGGFTVTEATVPVRVRQGSAWVPVNTALARGAGGRLAAQALPGDAVSFSGGGPGSLATITADGTSLSLSWPGTLPAPVVSGASATYRNVLPGVDLVLTALSSQAGGFSEVLVIRSAAAGRNPALSRLQLGVASHGVRLSGYQGGLVAAGAGVAGYYQAAAPQMWDSSAFAASRALPAGSVVSALNSAARSVGATVAPPGSGPAASSPAGPASGARVAPVSMAVGGGGSSLELTPDAALLSSPATQYPLYIAPSFLWHLAQGDGQHRDEVQSACASASHYDAPDGASDTYWSLGVGYDDWPPGDCQGSAGDAYSYYQVQVPSAIWGGSLYTATVNAQEAWAASCSTDASVTLSMTGGIGAGTNWDNAPHVIGSNSVTDTVTPDASSCGTSYDTSPSAWSGVGFNVLTEMKSAAHGRWNTFTFRLWEQGSPSDLAWERYGPAPYVQIQYNQTPDTPKALEISSGTTLDDDCTTSPYPWIGMLTSGGTEMRAVVHDKDGDQLDGAFSYWKNGSSAKTPVVSAPVGSGGTAEAEIPDTYTNGLKDGTEIDWDVYAFDGAGSAYEPDGTTSAQCHFYVYPSRAAAPAVSGGPGATEPVPGTAETFTLTPTALAGTTAKAIVWGLDKAPSDTSPAPTHVVPVASGAKTASVTIDVPSGGPHAFYGYTEYASGPVSQLATDPFVASNDPVVSCPSFADALSNNSCTVTSSSGTASAATSTAANRMISNGASNTSGTGDGDGGGATLPASQLTTAGWKSGGTVTVDGATFTLPSYGSSTSGDDNLLAANQIIGMTGEGTSLVFLATATNADAAVPDSAGLPADAPTSPAVYPGTNVAGQDCDLYQVGEQDSTGTNPVCSPAPEGVITYASGSGVGAQTYYLTVPDWLSATPSTAALTLPDYANGSGPSAHKVGIYAFSVPITPGAAISSVTLPDVGALVDAGASTPWPALHIFGIAVANTTTATPGSTAAAGAGPWTGAWASPAEGAFAPKAGTEYENQTIRLVTQASAPGSTLRVRLSDALAASQTSPLSIGAVTVAEQSSGAATTGTPTAVTFGGSTSVKIPEGADVYSDPVAFPVTAGEFLTVSIYLSGTYPSLPEETYCSACTEYVTAASAAADDQTGDTTGTPFSGTGTFTGDFSTILTGVDVTSGASGTTLPTVVVLGNGITDGSVSGSSAVHGAYRVSDDLASALELQPGGPAFGVVNAGIEANRVLTDSYTGTGSYGGPSALSRLTRDVLAEPGVGTVIIDEGEEDLLYGATDDGLYFDGLQELERELNAWGITVIYGTISACYGYSPAADPCTSAVDTTRVAVNTDLLENGANPAAGCGITQIPPALPPCLFTADFSAATGNTASPQQLASPADAGDHVNLTNAGYLAESGTIPVITGATTPLAAVGPVTP